MKQKNPETKRNQTQKKLTLEWHKKKRNLEKKGDYSGKCVASVGNKKACLSNSAISNSYTFDESCSSSCRRTPCCHFCLLLSFLCYLIIFCFTLWKKKKLPRSVRVEFSGRNVRKGLRTLDSESFIWLYIQWWRREREEQGNEGKGMKRKWQNLWAFCG